MVFNLYCICYIWHFSLKSHKKTLRIKYDTLGVKGLWLCNHKFVLWVWKPMSYLNYYKFFSFTLLFFHFIFLTKKIIFFCIFCLLTATSCNLQIFAEPCWKADKYLWKCTSRKFSYRLIKVKSAVKHDSLQGPQNGRQLGWAILVDCIII